MLLERLRKRRVATSSKAVAMGLLLFVITVGGFFLFIAAPLQAIFGFLGAAVGLLLTLIVGYFIYAYAVKHTGYKPTL